MKYRKSDTSDEAYTKTEKWNCDTCHTDKEVVKEIPIPTEKAMLVKHLMPYVSNPRSSSTMRVRFDIP
jgi:hypothetical protein